MIEGILIGLKTALTFQNINNGYDRLFFWNHHRNAAWSWTNDSNRVNDTHYLWI